MVADAVRFQEHVIAVHRHRVGDARGAASGDGDHLAIGQCHGDVVAGGHRVAGGIDQAGRVGDGATVFGGRRGGCQLHGHRVGIVGDGGLHRRGIEFQMFQRTGGAGIGFADGFDVVADAVRFQEHIVAVHRHRVGDARGTAGGDGDHLAIGQGHGDVVAGGHRVAGGIDQAGRVGDGATVFGGRRGGCQLHGHRVGIVGDGGLHRRGIEFQMFQRTGGAGIGFADGFDVVADAVRFQEHVIPVHRHGVRYARGAASGDGDHLAIGQGHGDGVVRGHRLAGGIHQAGCVGDGATVFGGRLSRFQLHGDRVDVVGDDCAHRRGVGHQLLERTILAFVGFADGFDVVADAVRFQEHVIPVHRHGVRYARGAASGDGDHLAIGQGHGDGVVRGHRLAGGIHQAGRVGDGAAVFSGRRGGCQLHGHRVGVVLHLGRGGAAGVQRLVIAAFGLGNFKLLALCALQVAIVRAGVGEHRACELAHLDGDGFAGLERDDQIRALGRLVHRGGDRDLTAFGHLGIGAEHDLGGVLVVHHIGAGGAGGIQAVVAATRGGADFKEMLVRTLHIGIVRTGGNLHRARGFADPDDDDFAGPERDDQIAPAGCTVHGGGHDDHAAFRHLLLCAQGQCAFVQRRQRGAGRTAQAVFHHVACGTGVGQRQRRCGFQHAGQTHKGVVTTTTTGIGCGSGIQLGQGILAVVDGGNQVLHQRIDRSGHGGLRGRNVFEHIRAQGHILVLAQDQRWLPVGLQHHGAA